MSRPSTRSQKPKFIFPASPHNSQFSGILSPVALHPFSPSGSGYALPVIFLFTVRKGHCKNASAHQRISASAHQRISASAHQRISASAHQRISGLKPTCGRRVTRLLRAAVPGLLFLAPLTSAHAQKLWTGNAGTSNWFTSQNWAGNTLPSASDNVQNNTRQTIQFGTSTTLPTSIISSFTANGLLNLQRGTLTVNGNVAFTGTGFLQMNGGTLANANIQDSSQVSFTGGTSILSNVTLGGTNGLNVNNGGVTIKGTFAYANGTTFNVGTSGDAGSIAFNGSRTLDNATFNLSRAPVTSSDFNSTGDLLTNVGFEDTAPATLTLGNNLLVQGAGTVGYNQSDYPYVRQDLINNGTLRANIAGLGMRIRVNNSGVNSNNGAIVNNATMEAIAGRNPLLPFIPYGASISVEGAFTNNGTLRALNGGYVSTSDGTTTRNSALGVLRASGTNSLLVIQGSLSNAGLLEAVTGGSINNAGMVTTTGTVNIGTDSTFTTVTAITQTAGNTNVNGTLTRTGSGDVLLLQGGMLTGSGTINGNVVNTGGTVNPGNSPGTLTISGNYTQSGTGNLLMEIAGTGTGQFDRLLINGTANLGGTLTLSFINGFVPIQGQTFTLLTATSTVGNFNAFQVLNPGVSYNYSNGVITVTQVITAAPEPGSFAFLLFGAFGGGLALLRFRVPVAR